MREKFLKANDLCLKTSSNFSGRSDITQDLQQFVNFVRTGKFTQAAQACTLLAKDLQTAKKQLQSDAMSKNEHTKITVYVAKDIAETHKYIKIVEQKFPGKGVQSLQKLKDSLSDLENTLKTSLMPRVEESRIQLSSKLEVREEGEKTETLTNRQLESEVIIEEGVGPMFERAESAKEVHDLKKVAEKARAEVRRAGEKAAEEIGGAAHKRETTQLKDIYNEKLEGGNPDARFDALKHKTAHIDAKQLTPAQAKQLVLKIVNPSFHNWSSDAEARIIGLCKRASEDIRDPRFDALLDRTGVSWEG